MRRSICNSSAGITTGLRYLRTSSATSKDSRVEGYNSMASSKVTQESTTGGSPSRLSTPPGRSNSATDVNDFVDADDAGDAEGRIPKNKRNAFDTLMSSPSRANKTGPPTPSKKHKANDIPSSKNHHPSRPGRNALGAYTQNPASFPSDIVLYYNDSFVVIRDAYPKSSIHVLLLPRTSRDTLHPFIAFQDPELLAATKAEAGKVAILVAEELGRKFGRFSVTEQARRRAIESATSSSSSSGEYATATATATGTDHENAVNADAATALPQGRNWLSEVMIGIHAGPSMNHLHVHILSRDRTSPALKHRKHYNSFATDFFVGLDELPLAAEDARWRPDCGGGLSRDLKCWRCGKGFGRKFVELKMHLEEEFEEWKRI